MEWHTLPHSPPPEKGSALKEVLGGSLRGRAGKECLLNAKQVEIKNPTLKYIL